MSKFFRQKHLRYYAIFLLLIFFGFLIYRRSRPQDPNLFDPKTDTVVLPVVQDIQDSITLAGSIDASQKATLRFQSPGILSWVGVQKGDSVRKWQAIASLNKTDLRKRLQIQFNNYQTALSNFNDTQYKYKEIKEKLLVTEDIQRILDRAQFSLDNAVIAYELDDLTIKYATLTSPINGIVVDLTQPNSGLNITPADTSFTIINPESIFFKASIDQEIVTKAQVGQPVEITIDAFPEKTFESQIDYIAFTPVAGETSTLYEIHFKLNDSNQDQQYRLGMDGSATIIFSEVSQALTIPIDAVYDDNGQKYVFTKSDKQLVRKNVKIGIETDTDSQILEGISKNDQIVIQKN